ncbi:MAG: hypothetical protein OEY09_17900 [Gammaproteobacteria bacterium]|nr:hypothetical protein [Gammaproteobacteria bacterium]
MSDEDKTELMTPEEKYEYQFKSEVKVKKPTLSQDQWLDFFAKTWKAKSKQKPEDAE